MSDNRKYVFILILLGIISGLSGILQNIASDEIPNTWEPYLWTAWPLFFISMFLGIGLAIWQSSIAQNNGGYNGMPVHVSAQTHFNLQQAVDLIQQARDILELTIQTTSVQLELAYKMLGDLLNILQRQTNAAIEDNNYHLATPLNTLVRTTSEIRVAINGIKVKEFGHIRESDLMTLENIHRRLLEIQIKLESLLN